MNRTVLLAAALLAASAGAASAADMAEGWPTIVPADREGPVEFGSAWYMRGDIGIALYADPDIGYSGGAMAATASGGELDKTWTAGVGIGTRFGKWFRTDVTFDYHMATDYSAGGTSACGGAGTSCAISTTADFSTYTLLINGYVDLPVSDLVTPYLGVGVGGSFVDWNDYAEVHRCTAGCAITERYALSTDDRWRFAYAAMAGVSFDVAPNLKVDAGYRFLGIGKGDIVDAVAGVPVAEYDKLYSHELRVGLRYEIE
ncbi:MAG TPA: porin family protein [Hyphomicrobiales bacterium]|nr:porin family protein [Kaistiaceae bacterium]HQF31607.1 porin family protein [Hyphomicrobiales bacterium]